MEKFRIYTDKATGINPFVPVKGLDRISTGRGILGAFLLVGTLPIIFVLDLIDLAYESLYTFASACYAQAIIATLLGPLQYLVTRLYLILLHHSFWNGKYTVYPQKRKAAASSPSSPSSSSNGREDDEPVIKGGTVLVCNLQSPIDIVILHRMFWSTPLFFCMPCHDEEGTVNKTPNLWWSAFRQTAFLRILSAMSSSSAAPQPVPKSVDLRALQMLGRRLGRPVVFFAEGAVTNGKSVVQLPAEIITDPVSGSIVPVGITYQNAQATNTTIPQSFFSFLVRLLGESALSGGNSVDVSIGRPSLVTNLVETGAVTLMQSPPAAGKQVPEFQKAHIKGDALQKLVADTASFERVSGAPCRVVPLSSEDKAKFLQMWETHGKLV